MRALTLPIKIVLFLILLGFAARNSEAVTLRYFLGLERTEPLKAREDVKKEMRRLLTETNNNNTARRFKSFAALTLSR